METITREHILIAFGSQGEEQPSYDLFCMTRTIFDDDDKAIEEMQHFCIVFFSMVEDGLVDVWDIKPAPHCSELMNLALHSQCCLTEKGRAARAETVAENSKKSRAYTEDEIREQFLIHIKQIVNYWLKESRSPEVTDKANGIAFSILAALDGCSMGVPGFKLIPNPHPDDKQYHMDRGENWYPDNVNIGGYLHELYYNAEEEENGENPTESPA